MSAGPGQLSSTKRRWNLPTRCCPWTSPRRRPYIFGVLGMAPQQTFAASRGGPIPRRGAGAAGGFFHHDGGGELPDLSGDGAVLRGFRAPARGRPLLTGCSALSTNTTALWTWACWAAGCFSVCFRISVAAISAFRMVVRPAFPSYGSWIAQGATSLWEDFLPVNAKPNSRNHHFWGRYQRLDDRMPGRHRRQPA